MKLINNSDEITSKNKYVIETGVGFVKTLLVADPINLTLTSDSGETMTFSDNESYEVTIRQFTNSTSHFVYEV